MSEQRHTPGPWEWDRDGERTLIMDHRGLHLCAAIKDSDGTLEGTITPGERDANARLIAAAPELLKYAERALDQLTNDREEGCWCYDEVDGSPDSPPPGRCLACHLRAAIEKARGG